MHLYVYIHFSEQRTVNEREEGERENGGVTEVDEREMSSSATTTSVISTTTTAIICCRCCSTRHFQRPTRDATTTTTRRGCNDYVSFSGGRGRGRNIKKFSLLLRARAERSEEEASADKIVDGMDFGELCNDFECISSPSVEATARQLARDILELRQGNRALGTYALYVTYKDPVRSFIGRDKYKRPLWVTDALDKPTASVQEMAMLSTSVLSIKWTVRGKPKSPLANIIIGGGELIIRVTSQFILNQISGQVIEHEELWDLSASSALAQTYFWTSRRIFATIEAGKDLADSVKDIRSRFSAQKENIEIYPDPSGDPTKFFQNDDGFQRDVYQLALFLAVIYLVVQFLRITL